MEGKKSNTDFLGFSPSKPKDKGDNELSNDEIEQANAMAKQLHVYKSGINFVPGANVEVLDIRDNNWYHCKVVEVDWGELDILVHYQKWSNRFDEWLKMDSTRLRPYVARHSRKIKKKPFLKTGDTVLARWAPDGRNYQAKVTKIVNDECCEVLFYDGVTKMMRTTNVYKYDPKNEGFGAGPSGFSSPTPQRRHTIDNPNLIGYSPDDANKSSIFEVKILEQKRKPKRKAEYEELIQNIKKKRKMFEDMQTTPEPKKAVVPKPVTPKPVIIKPLTPKPATPKPATPKPVISEQVIAKKKIPDASISVQRQETNSPVPKSSTANMFQFLQKNGWTKLCARRPGKSDKWDAFYVTPKGKKLRTKTDVIKYKETYDLDIDVDSFDFSTKCVRAELLKQNLSVSKDTDTDDTEDNSVKDSDGEEAISINSNTTPKTSFKPIQIDDADSKKEEEPPTIKEKPPVDKSTKKIASHKVEIPILPSIPSGTPLPAHSVKFPIKIPLPLPAVQELISSGDLSKGIPKSPTARKDLLVGESSYKPEHNEHVCPKKECGKSFRKGSLLQMHIKHYHPQLFKKAKVCAPNVADLAYARTVGDHLDHSPSHSVSMYQSTPDKWTKTDSPARRLSRQFISEGRKLDLPVKEHKKKEQPIDTEDKEELDEFMNDLEEEEEQAPPSIAEADPDYIPDEGEVIPPKRRYREREGRKERRRERAVELRNRKRKPESMSEDDFDRTHNRVRLKRRPIPPPSRIAAPHIQDAAVVETPTAKKAAPKEDLAEVEDENGDTWTEIQETANIVDGSNEIINCGCGSNEEEGLMLLCDVCLCWQHGACYNINKESEVPDKYICSLCDNPKLQRSSHKYRHHQDWLKEGRLPRFSFAEEDNDARLGSCVRRSHELMANVWQLGGVMHSLRLKLNMAKLADHPKFVLWHQKWLEEANTNETNTNPLDNQNILDMNMISSLDAMSVIDQVMGIGSNPIIQDLSNQNKNDTMGLAGQTDQYKNDGMGLSGQTDGVDVSGQQHVDGFDVSDQSKTDVNVSDQTNKTDIERMDITDESDSTKTSELDGKSHEKIDKSSTSNQSQPHVDNVNQDNVEINQSKTTKLDKTTNSDNEQANLSSNIDEPSSVHESTSGIPTSAFYSTARKSIDNKAAANTVQEIKNDESESKNEECESSLENLRAVRKPVVADSLNQENVDSSKNKNKNTQSASPEIIESGDSNEEKVSTEQKKSDIVTTNDSDKKESDCETKYGQTKIESKVMDTKIKDESKMQIDIVNEQNKNKNTIESNIKNEVVEQDDETENKNDPQLDQNSLNIKSDVKESTENIKNKSENKNPETKIDVKNTQIKGNETNEVTNELKLIDTDSQSSLVPCTTNDNLPTNTDHEMANLTNTDEQPTNDYPSADDLKPSLTTTKLDEEDMDNFKIPLTSLSQDTLSSTSQTESLIPQKEDNVSDFLKETIDLEGKDDLFNEENTTDEEGKQICETDDLELDLRGLTSSAEAAGTDFADILTSQDDIAQLIGHEDNPDLTSLEVQQTPIQAPIIPETERIIPINCKLNLLENVKSVQKQIENRFDEIEKHLEVLEMEMGLAGEPVDDPNDEDDLFRDGTTLQARDLVKLIVNDLSTIQKISQFSTL